MPLTPSHHTVLEALHGRNRPTAQTLAEVLGQTVAWTVVALYDLMAQGHVRRYVEGHENATATWSPA